MEAKIRIIHFYKGFLLNVHFCLLCVLLPIQLCVRLVNQEKVECSIFATLAFRAKDKQEIGIGCCVWTEEQ